MEKQREYAGAEMLDNLTVFDQSLQKQTDQVLYTTPGQRLADYHAGRLTRLQCNARSAHYPEEMEETLLINGELPWIALSLADLD